MSASVFPSSTAIPGMDIEITRSPEWTTIVQSNVSGKEVRVAQQVYSRRAWMLQFNILRTSTAYLELQTMAGFFNNRSGRFDSFLWSDQDDNTVSAQAVGVGDAATLSFQLVRTYGGYTEPVYAPNSVTSVTISNTTIGSTKYAIGPWGSSSPGILTFLSTTPGAGQSIAVSMTYYWPVRFVDDSMDFHKMVYNIWENKKVGLMQII